MDILAHTLWANYGSRVANRLINKKNKKGIKQVPKIKVFWASFFGVAPDFFAFTIPFIMGVLSGSFFDHHGPMREGFSLAAFLYQYSHSLVIWAVVFIVVWFLYKRPRFELCGWLLHILIDIPSHTLSFFPTPLFFPISEYRFPYGLEWSNKYYMIINYSLLLIVSLYLMFSYKKAKKNT